MSKKTWIIFAAIVVVLFGVLIISANSNKINVSRYQSNSIIPATKDNGETADHVTGNPKSSVILVEYGDYQCPYCGEAFPAVKTVTDTYSSQIAFIFRNFPLTSLHPDALAAAAAAEAAGQQGKYWQMHDLLYENQSAWDSVTAGPQLTSVFTSYAKQLGLNTTQFQTALSSSKTAQKISFDQALGNKLGVNSTPSFYLNGTPLPQSIISDLEQSNTKPFESLINADLRAAGITPPASTTH